MPKSIKAMLAILGGPMGGKGRSCPECDSPMESDGTCSECGYGENEEEYEDEDEGESDDHMDRMIEVRDDLQRIVDKLSKMIS
jgi:uncharacterized Zn finger protein (UPF0148 family)